MWLRNGHEFPILPNYWNYCKTIFYLATTLLSYSLTSLPPVKLQLKYQGSMTPSSLKAGHVNDRAKRSENKKIKTIYNKRKNQSTINHVFSQILSWDLSFLGVGWTCQQNSKNDVGLAINETPRPHGEAVKLRNVWLQVESRKFQWSCKKINQLSIMDSHKFFREIFSFFTWVGAVNKIPRRMLDWP